MAYNSRLTAALSGVTEAQLAYWRQRRGGKPSLLRPEYRPDNRVLYSFRDVVALRTVAYLREDVSLQKIRRAVSNLRGLGEHEHLSEYELVATGRSITLVTTDAQGIDLVEEPGQRVLASMVDVLGAFENKRGVIVPDFFNPRPLLSVDEATLAGYPVVVGTRIPFDLVADLVADGVPPEKIADFYPGVSGEAAGQARNYAMYVNRELAPAV